MAAVGIIILNEKLWLEWFDDIQTLYLLCDLSGLEDLVSQENLLLPKPHSRGKRSVSVCIYKYFFNSSALLYIWQMVWIVQKILGILSLLYFLLSLLLPRQDKVILFIQDILLFTSMNDLD